MRKAHLEIIKEHGPYRIERGQLLDGNGITLAAFGYDEAEKTYQTCDWDRAVVAALNEIHSTSEKDP
jgi:hypothetical protein